MDTPSLNVCTIASKYQFCRLLTDDDTFRQWTASFVAGCCNGVDWRMVDRVRPMDPDGNDMIRLIEENRPSDTRSMRLAVVVKAGNLDAKSELGVCVGSREAFKLRDADGGRELTVRVDTREGYKANFDEAWQRTLSNVKSLSDTNGCG
ncbi:MAG: hypothetical protein OXE87_02950 [Chloroflexi bacterium]|nr:hypothetical protein [Chloroflexota bacterium]